MTKSEFISAVSKRSGHTTKDVQSVLRSFQHVILEQLKSTGEIGLLDLGKFKISERAARTGVNPRDPGEKISIPAKKVPQLKTSKKFKDLIDGSIGVDDFNY